MARLESEASIGLDDYRIPKLGEGFIGLINEGISKLDFAEEVVYVDRGSSHRLGAFSKPRREILIVTGECDTLNLCIRSWQVEEVFEGIEKLAGRLPYEIGVIKEQDYDLMLSTMKKRGDTQVKPLWRREIIKSPVLPAETSVKVAA